MSEIACKNCCQADAAHKIVWPRANAQGPLSKTTAKLVNGSLQTIRLENELGRVWHIWKRLRYDLKTRTSNVDFGSKVYSLLSRDQQDWAVQNEPQGGGRA